MYNEVLHEVEAAWASIVGTKGDQELRAFFIHGTIIAVSEAGFVAPKAGQDAEWLKKHYPAFKKKADEGDEDFQELMEDLKKREAFRSITGEINGTS